jgi:hypothetical protein
MDISDPPSCSEFSQLNGIHLPLVVISMYKKSIVSYRAFKRGKASHRAETSNIKDLNYLICSFRSDYYQPGQSTQPFQYHHQFSYSSSLPLTKVMCVWAITWSPAAVLMLFHNVGNDVSNLLLHTQMIDLCHTLVEDVIIIFWYL